MAWESPYRLSPAASPSQPWRTASRSATARADAPRGPAAASPGARHHHHIVALRTAHHVQQPRLAGNARSALDHAPAGVRLVPRVHRRVPLVAAQGGQRGRDGWETAAQPGRSWRSPGGRADDRWPEVRADRRPATHQSAPPGATWPTSGSKFPSRRGLPGESGSRSPSPPNPAPAATSNRHCHVD